MCKARNFSLLNVVLTLFIFGSVVAKDGVAMLKIDHGARSAGMGATSFSQDQDPNNVVFNPALAVGFQKFSASFGHTEFWDNIRLESGFFAADVAPKLSLHGGIRYAAVTDLQGRTSPTSTPEILFDAHDVSMKGGVAYKLTGKISVGAAAGWIIEKIEGYRGSAFNVDAGAIAHIRPNVDLGASITNLGSSFKLQQPGVTGSDDIFLPTAYRIGGAYKYKRYLGAAELVYLDEKAHVHLGAEAKLNDIFSLRSGYMINYDTKNFTAGASFSHRNITVDYAFIPFTENLGTTYLFNLTFSL